MSIRLFFAYLFVGILAIGLLVSIFSDFYFLSGIKFTILFLFSCYGMLYLFTKCTPEEEVLIKKLFNLKWLSFSKFSNFYLFGIILLLILYIIDFQYPGILYSQYTILFITIRWLLVLIPFGIKFYYYRKQKEEEKSK